jgi:ATP adenylyltransferase
MSPSEPEVRVLERLWNGWRSAYVQGGADVPSPTGEGSVFTRILASGLDDTETNIVHRGTTCFTILNAFPYSTGHVLILPYREVADLEDLDADETAELWSMTKDAVIAIKRAYVPEGINLGINLGKPAGGSVSEHLHVHVVPRWTGDSNFMTAIANTRTLPEALPDTAARLRAAWPNVT